MESPLTAHDATAAIIAAVCSSSSSKDEPEETLSPFELSSDATSDVCVSHDGLPCDNARVSLP
eukprot:scaffold241023_cov35-Prasinocladus_malaysianus.AAC.1